MKNEKKSRRTCHLSSDLKDIIKYILIFGTILVFGVYLLADAEVLGNVKSGRKRNSGLGNKSADNICRRYYVFSTGSENPKL